MTLRIIVIFTFCLVLVDIVNFITFQINILNWLIDLLSLILTALYLKRILTQNYVFFASSGYQILYFVGLIASFIVSYRPVYLPEVAVTAVENIEISICAFLFVSTLEATRIGFSIRVNFGQIRIKRSSIFLILLSIIGLIFFIGLLVYLQFGSPWTLNISRSDFWRNTVSGPLRAARSIIVYGMLFASIYIVKKMSTKILRDRILAAIVFLLYSWLILFILGDKFSGFIIFLSALLLVDGVFRETKIRVFRFFLVISGTLGLLILGVAFSYSSSSFVDGENVAEIVRMRIASQGQLLWLLTNHDSAIIPFGDKSFMFYSFKELADFISFTYQPNDLAILKVESSGTLSGYLPTAWITVFGLWFFIPAHYAISFILGVFQKLLTTELKYDAIFSGFVIFALLTSINAFWYAIKIDQLPRILILLTLISVISLIKSATKRWPTNEVGSNA